jgi:hypothetical protein
MFIYSNAQGLRYSKVWNLFKATKTCDDMTGTAQDLHHWIRATIAIDATQ